MNFLQHVTGTAAQRGASPRFADGCRDSGHDGHGQDRLHVFIARRCFMVVAVEHAKRDECHLTATSSQASLVETFCMRQRTGSSHPAFGFSAGDRHSSRCGKHVYAHLQTLTVG